MSEFVKFPNYFFAEDFKLTKDDIGWDMNHNGISFGFIADVDENYITLEIINRPVFDKFNEYYKDRCDTSFLH